MAEAERGHTCRGGGEKVQMGKQKEGRRGTVGNIHIAYSSQACPGSGQRGEPGNNANILTKGFLSGGRSGGREACGGRHVEGGVRCVGRVTCNRKQSFFHFFEIISRRLSLHVQTHKY